MGFLGEVERLFAELYPYRWTILIGLLAVTAAVVLVGYRMGWHRSIWRHRVTVAIRGHRLIATAGLRWHMWIWQRRQGVAIAATPVLLLVIVGHYYPSVWNY